ncbi:MAG: gliding motility-associated C-terminal domain-containing protein [Saprospiraceae bacterium]
MMKHFNITLFGFLLPLINYAQNASVQDCLGAIPVCQQVYVEDTSPVGFGDFDEVDPVINCVGREQNSIWYVFTVDNDGKFGFLLTPNDLSDDYDWALFNITNASCAEVLTNADLLISCNSAGSGSCDGVTGATGDSQYHYQGSNCDNFPPTLYTGYTPFNDLIDVVAGNTYVLLINNFSGSTNGYTLDFGLSGDIGIFDEINPFLETANLTDACNGSQIRLEFSEYIQCATLDDANFQLTGPGEPYSLALNSANCDAGGNYSKEFFLDVTPAITDGGYTLTMNVDGTSEALDLCDNPAAGITFQINGPSQIPVIDLGSDTTLCDGVSLTLDASQLAGTYLWSTGSTAPTIDVTATGNYSVQVTTACGIASDDINVTFSSTLPLDLGPDLELCPGETATLDATSPGGTYHWSDGSTGPTLLVTQAGTYSVQVSSDCGTAEDTVTITVVPAIAAVLNDAALCPGESVSWDVTTPNATYLWQDGSNGPTFTATDAGNYAVTITNSCETVNLSATVQSGGSLPQIDLGNDTTLCNGQTLLIDPGIAGASFLWQDGSTDATLMVSQPGTYAVTVSNNCDQQVSSIQVYYLEPITATLQDAALCPGETIIWDVTSPEATYIWQDGSTTPTLSPLVAGNYSVTITNSCEEVILSSTVQMGTALTSIELGSDTTLCAGESLTFDFSAITDADFLWQDNSTSPNYTITQNGVYQLTISNNCDTLSDMINVRVVSPITINLGPDTVLCNGANLSINATQADIDYYVWQDGTTTPEYVIRQPGTYTLTAGNDCEEVFDDITIAECETCEFFVPNSFSPNNDGINDVFQAFSNCPLQNFNLTVFDRWGTLLFESKDPESGWDGQSKGQFVKSGVYIWVMKVMVMENEVPREVSLAGDVTILR